MAKRRNRRTYALELHALNGLGFPLTEAARGDELSLRMVMRLIEQAEMLEGLPTLH